MKKHLSIRDIEGDWVEPDFNSSLIERCRDNWSKPVKELPNYVLATFLRQKFGLSIAIPEAQKRIKSNYLDGSELYDEELENALKIANET